MREAFGFITIDEQGMGVDLVEICAPQIPKHLLRGRFPSGLSALRSLLSAFLREVI
jgi:hypothetical protein